MICYVTNCRYFRKLFSNEDDKNSDVESDEKSDEIVGLLQFVREKVNDDDNDDSDSDEDDIQWIEHVELDVKIWKCLFDSKSIQ